MKVVLGSRSMAYETVGSGQPVVLLHAFPFDSRMWRDTAAALAKRVQIITPDLRGFGQSDLGDGGFSIADLADDVAALLDNLSIPTATVGGMSMGGYVALAFAARHGSRLRSLILADTKAAADTPEARQGRENAIDLVQTQGVGAMLDRQIPRLLSANANDSVRAQVRRLGEQSPATVIAGIRALRDRPDRTPELASIKVPTLLVVGTEDVLSPPAEARDVASRIAQARVVTIPGAGHLSCLENPEAFAAALMGFL
jgi:3-oxoadipate enol-lactonase